MKVLIPAARDTSIRPFAQQRNQHFLPLANRPMIFYVLEKLAEARLNDIGVVITKGDESLSSALGSGSRFGVNLTYIPQEGGTRGIAHALMVAKDFLQDEPFLVHLGNNIVRDPIADFVNQFNSTNISCLLAFARVPNPQRFGVPVLEQGKLVRVEERPFHPQSPYAVAGLYFYRPEVHEVLPHLKPSSRGDYEISDVHTYLIERGHPIDWVELSGWWKDTGKPEDLLEGNRFVLEALKPDIRGEIIPPATVTGLVSVGRGTRILGRSIVVGPAVIGEGCLIKDAYIGPYTSVGDRAEIHGGEIENSIVFEEARISTPKRIQGSIIGERAVIAKEEDTKPSGHRLFIGEGAVVDL